jgi:hypothetical protein
MLKFPLGHQSGRRNSSERDPGINVNLNHHRTYQHWVNCCFQLDSQSGRCCRFYFICHLHRLHSSETPSRRSTTAKQMEHGLDGSASQYLRTLLHCVCFRSFVLSNLQGGSHAAEHELVQRRVQRSRRIRHPSVLHAWKKGVQGACRLCSTRRLI